MRQPLISQRLVALGVAVGVDAHRAQRPVLLGQQALQRVHCQRLAIQQHQTFVDPAHAAAPPTRQQHGGDVRQRERSH